MKSEVRWHQVFNIPQIDSRMYFSIIIKVYE